MEVQGTLKRNKGNIHEGSKSYISVPGKFPPKNYKLDVHANNLRNKAEKLFGKIAVVTGTFEYRNDGSGQYRLVLVVTKLKAADGK